MKDEKFIKYFLYGGIGIALIIVVITVVAIRRMDRSEEPSQVVSSNATVTPPVPTAPEKPELSRNDIIRQLIQTTTGEVYDYKKDGLLEQLAEYDPRDAVVWETILDYWYVANADGFVNSYTILPIRDSSETEEESAGTTVNSVAMSDTATTGSGSDSGTGAQTDAEADGETEIPAPLTIEEMLALMESHDDPLPDDLPQDNSLCIVVLGFQLNADGSIRQELVNRLTAAYLCAQQYPNAYVLTTGGPTASSDRSATEAEAMADYLVENGLNADRMIVENASMTTYENAIYSCGILSTQFPEVDSIVVVSSDYHIPMGCLLFEAQSLIDTCDLEGKTPLHVIANVGCQTDGHYYFGASSQASQLSSLSY